MPKQLRLATQVALLLALAAPLALAQGRGGPGGGWGGPGGPGGGTSPADLIQMPVVQDEIKLTDKQKTQIKQTKEAADKKRVQVQESAQKVATAARIQAAQEAAALAEANGGTPVDPNANANGNGNNGGRGGRGNRNDPAAQAMRQTMDNFDNEVDASLVKILDAKQKARVKQISLQAEGVSAFVNNSEVIEKLGLAEEQVAAIAAIRDDSRQSGRQLMGQLFNNGNNNGGGPGGPGGRGGFGGPPDPAMFQSPEFQAKLKTVQESQTKLDDQTMVSVGKALTKAQKTTYNKMIGDKFDVAQLRRGMLDRFRPPGTPATPLTQQASAAAPAPATTAAAPATTAATPATKPAARKSLRDARGGSSQP